MRRAIQMLWVVMVLGLAGCDAVPWAKPVSLQSPEADRVKAALANWPKPATSDVLRRPFFATIHVAGMRTTASGILEYHGPRDFRVTAVTELGALLFDGRVNWGGVAILRQMPGIDTAGIETLLADLVRAFDLPGDVDGLKAGSSKMVITRRLPDEHEYSWVFDREDGRLVQTEVNLGLLDTLRIAYNGYSARGWPKELQVVRRARFYEVSFSFTDDVVVQGAGSK